MRYTNRCHGSDGRRDSDSGQNCRSRRYLRRGAYNGHFLAGMELGEPASLPPNPSAVAIRKPTVPLKVRALLGTSWILKGEDPQLYEELLAQVGEAVGARDIVDWLLVSDYVALTWDLQRSRRIRDSLMRDACSSVVFDILWSAMPKGTPDKEGDIVELYGLWRKGGEAGYQRVAEKLAEQGITEADLSARAYANIAERLDEIDRQNERRENRQRALLQEIERRHRGWGQQVKRATEEIMDADFSDVTPTTLPKGQQ
jgi:hypothetical protein